MRTWVVVAFLILTSSSFGYAQGLSQQELDALRTRLMQNWNPPVDNGGYAITLRVRLNRDGTFQMGPQVLTAGSGSQFNATRDSAVRAVLKSAPFTMLSQQSYESWKEFDFTFDPRIALYHAPDRASKRAQAEEVAPITDDATEPFNKKVVAQAFELSKSCAKECSNEKVSLIRLPLPQGKVGFLMTTTDQSFCGSGGCSGMVVTVAGDKFVVLKEGQGISESEALSVASGDAPLPPSKSEQSYYVANAKPPDAFLSLRTEPSITAGRRIAQMPNGTELKVLLKQPDRWWHVMVISTGQEGWALSGQESVTWIDCCREADATIVANGKPSFDCSKATSASARLICSDAELSKADGLLGAKFKAVTADKDQVTRKQLVEQQLVWLRTRNKRCGVGPEKAKVPTEQLVGAKPCMMQAISQRIAMLDAPGPARSDATRDANVPVKRKEVSVATSSPEQNQNCIATNDGTDRGDIKWFGGCRDGYADGVGVARWFKDGILNYEVEYTRENGLIRVKGNSQVVPEIIDKKITLKLERCESYFERYVEVTADSSLVLYAYAVEEYITKYRAQTFAWTKCPSANYDNVGVAVSVGGKRIIQTRSYNPDVAGPTAPYKTKWREYNNEAYNSRIAQYDRNYQNQMAARYQAQQQEQQRQQAEEAQRRAQAKQAFRGKVWADLGIQKWAGMQEINANPFLFKGNVVGLYTVFGGMLSESEAYFRINGSIIRVSGVPSTMFRGNEPVILALRIVGNTQMNGPLGETVVPYGEYVGAYKCVQNNCSEYFD